MNNFEVGKLYKCPKRYLFICSEKSAIEFLIKEFIERPWTKNTITAALIDYWDIEYNGAIKLHDGIAYWREYWEGYLGCDVFCSKPHDVFMVVDKKFHSATKCFYTKILYKNILGWIITNDTVKFVNVTPKI